MSCHRHLSLLIMFRTFNCLMYNIIQYLNIVCILKVLLPNVVFLFFSLLFLVIVFYHTILSFLFSLLFYFFYFFCFDWALAQAQFKPNDHLRLGSKNPFCRAQRPGPSSHTNRPANNRPKLQAPVCAMAQCTNPSPWSLCTVKHAAHPPFSFMQAILQPFPMTNFINLHALSIRCGLPTPLLTWHSSFHSFTHAGRNTKLVELHTNSFCDSRLKHAPMLVHLAQKNVTD